MPQPHKIAVVEKTAARLRAAAAIYFTDYKGLSAPKATELRAKLRASDIDYVVLKKTLLRIAAQDAGIGEIDEFMPGQTAMALTGGEPSEPARILREFSKQNDDVPKITGIVLEGQHLSASRAQALATLPSKEVLLGRLLSAIQQPMTRLAGTISAPMTKLGQLLSTLKDQKTS